MIRDIFASLISPTWEKSVLKLAEKEGRQEGAEGLPTIGTPKYSVGETKVRVKIDEQLLTIQTILKDKVMATLPQVVKKKGEVDAAVLKFEERRPPEMLRTVLEGELEARRLALEDLSYKKHKSEGGYNKFRGEHGIQNDPDHPSAEKRKNLIAVALLLVLVETIFNALFWQVDLDVMLATGLVFALVLSFLNVFAGFCAGYYLPEKNLNVPGKKSKAWAIFFGLMIVVVFVIGWILWIRLSKESSSVDSSKNLMNVVVFIYGLAFALFAAREGYTYRGSYPGYEEASNNYLAAVTQLKSEQESLRLAVVHQSGQDENARHTPIRNIGDVLQNYAKTQGDFEVLAASYRAAVTYLNGVRENAVGVFRATNIATKGAALPSPDWFNEPIDEYEVDSDVVSGALVELAGAQNDATVALERIRQAATVEIPLITGIKNEFQARQITALFNQADRVGLDKYLEEIRDGVGNQGLGRRGA